MTNFAARWKRSFEKNGALPTAYLFDGPAGSGKKETAELIAQTLLSRIQNNADFIRIQPDKAKPESKTVSIRIEAIRTLIQRLSLKPLHGTRIVVLMEDTEKMTDEAANALLKTLEEPPAGTLFILLSSATEKLPSTIRSRCQRIVFEIPTTAVKERLQSLKPLWHERIEKLITRNSLAQASLLAEEVGKSEQFPSFLEYLKACWHDFAVYRGTGSADRLLIQEALPSIQRESGKRDSERIAEDMDFILETERAIEGNVNKTLALEQLFMKLISEK